MIIASFDIETIPDQNIPELCIPKLDESDVKYGNTKDPAKQQIILETKKTEFQEKLSKKMSVTAGLAQICTFVGIEYDTEENKIISKVSIQVTKEFNGDDLGAVSNGWDFVKRMYNKRVPLVSFNGIGFDFPVMWHRAIIQDVPIDKIMYDRLTPRYGGKFHYDLLGILAGWTLDKMKGHKLEFFLQRYKIGSKGDMDGSQVFEAWQLGEYDRIQKYCEADVLQTAELFARVEPWIKIDIQDTQDIK